MNKNTETPHLTVLLKETTEVFAKNSTKLVIDATLGFGGHSEKLLKEDRALKVIGLDQDERAIALANKRLSPFKGRFEAVHANFSEIRRIAEELDLKQIDGIIADLGVSSMQIDDEARGFSFRFDAPLDMRMDETSDCDTAADLLAKLPEAEIANLIFNYGEERFSRRIARRIITARENGKPILTTKQLADLVSRAVKHTPKDKIHPATRTFQALRIAVNRELDNLEKFLVDSIDLLSQNAFLAVISFHSLEDRIVKQIFRKYEGKCTCPPRFPKCVCGAEKILEVLTKRPLVPSETEMSANPRARSAKLRICRKL